MIDSGASHCFISEKLVRALQLLVDSTTGLLVVLGDGTQIQTQGICKDVKFVLDSTIFIITFYVFPLSSVDAILGVTWLATLGDITAN